MAFWDCLGISGIDMEKPKLYSKSSQMHREKGEVNLAQKQSSSVFDIVTI
jgi:hypothetical protein